jgi:drug/metabolite transporter (DMT)-like permease
MSGPVSTVRLAAAASLLAAMALTGANVAFGRAIAAECPIYLFLLFRFLVASAALAPLVRSEPGPRLRAMGRTERRDLVLMALLGMIGFTVLMLEGLRRTAATDAGVITATLPAVAAVLGVLVAGDRLSRPQAAAVGLAVAGLAIVQVAGAGSGGTATLIGNLLVAGAVLCEASFVLLGKRLAPPWRPLRLALGANLAGLALSLPLALPQMPGFAPAAVRPEVWALGTWYAVSSSVLCLWLWYRGLPHVPTWLAGLTTAAVPVAALASAALYLGEVPGTAQLAGAALVIAAIALGAFAPSRRRAGAGVGIDATGSKPAPAAPKPLREPQG